MVSEVVGAAAELTEVVRVGDRSGWGAGAVFNRGAAPWRFSALSILSAAGCVQEPAATSSSSCATPGQRRASALPASGCGSLIDDTAFAKRPVER